MAVLRRCKCGTTAETEEELELFVFHAQCRYQRKPTCKECHNEKERERHKKFSKTPERKQQVKRSRIKYTFGISLEEYEEAMSTSDKCEICSSTSDLCYDHNHNTGKFRGVLCRACNRALGSFGDSSNNLRSALKYLKEKGEYSCDN